MSQKPSQLKKDELKASTEKTEVSLFLKLFSCLLYAFASSSLTFVNKSIYIKFGFRSPLDVRPPSICLNPLTLVTSYSVYLQCGHLLLIHVMEDHLPQILLWT